LAPYSVLEMGHPPQWDSRTNLQNSLRILNYPSE
jgi:hypothetical protein